MEDGDDDPPEQAATRPDRPVERWHRSTAEVTAQVATVDVVLQPEARAFDGGLVRFALGDELGRGGMGRVVAATDTSLAREVAIKQALSDRQVDLERFAREARLTAKLEHPAIVPIYDAGRDALGRPFYIMRKIEGEALSDLVTRARTVRERIALVPNVLAAVDAAAFAHARHIIHRDIKPWNILIGSHGQTLLIDWGLARELAGAELPTGAAIPDSSELTHAGQAFGTPGYMAPEQARGERADERADVYALGATLFHVLAGVTPYDGSSATEWIERAARGVRIPLEKLAPEVPPELVAIVDKATAISREARYRHAGELAADLRAFLTGKLVAAHVYSSVDRVVRFVRRHRIAVAIGAAAIVALAVVSVLAVTNILQERDRADASRRTAEAGERLAAERAELMLLDRASVLASRDPARAVALLRGVASGSRQLARARDIAAAAAAHGVAHGIAVHRGAINVLELGPDRLLLSAGADATLRVHDLATGASRTLVEGVLINAAVWLDSTTVVCVVECRGLLIVDLVTGTTRAVHPEVNATELWAAGPARFWYLDANQRAIVEHGVTAPSESIIARDVTRAAIQGDRMVVEGKSGVRVLDPRGERVLGKTVRSFASTLGIAIAGDGSRGAVSLDDELVEWDLATGAVRQRWPLRHIHTMFYLGRDLLVAKPGVPGALDRLTGTAAVEVLRGFGSMFTVSRTPHGVVVVSDTGAIALLDDHGTYRITSEQPGSRKLAGSPSSPYVAIGGWDGTITWWDTRTVLPRRFQLDAGSRLCALDGERIFALVGTSITATALDTGETRALADGPYLACTQRHGGRRVIAQRLVADSYDVIDGVSGRVDRLTDARDVALDLDTGSVYFAEGFRVLRELRLDGSRHTRWTAPAHLELVTVAGRWGAALLPANQLARIDLTAGTHTVITTPGAVRVLVAAPDGGVWIVIGSALHRYDGHRLTLVATLPVAPDLVAYHPDGSVMVQATDQSLWRVDLTGATLRVKGAKGVRRIWFGARAVATADLGFVGMRFLDTGEQILRDIGTLPFEVALGDGDRLVAYQVGGHGDIGVFEDAGPREPAALHRWIDTVTNAAIDPHNDALTWRPAVAAAK
ncbi:MAG: serine/threonine-protein kinase [Kofleriaceae bacterium]